MDRTGILIVVVAAGLAALAQIRNDPRIDRKFTLRSLLALAGFAVGCAAGFVLIISRLDGPQREDVALAATLAIVAWIAFATLWLIRLAPRLREPPAFLMRPWGVIDLALLATAAARVPPILSCMPVRAGFAVPIRRMTARCQLWPSGTVTVSSVLAATGAKPSRPAPRAGIGVSAVEPRTKAAVLNAIDPPRNLRRVIAESTMAANSLRSVRG